ncbi:bifunctional diaminohydroxyphosphoribosylaminopyrimidine deaminase/5-amino-6-(5-phosphoribosylamino)uracil reductase RibD [Flavicella sediminum]|uniref:bifunctional diaminohydroxyphosphoribosylaminopyrimidine deaminase/5-amino-6-(5-phosphoribosylamino)uracil reductase RibD n=1 Tax=Flavicella sediminum TaxID=2585141 RepID=UPI00111D0C66|nr:bifunctional diaminohydroxyphosphoribosylaminopyrimidine deaminase/5-amino-6-(5-phosphoribosylamino)uracil reductase RibD [Flavicella sediminum]
MKNHEHFIARCLELANKGIGTTRPNPSVGAVVVCDGLIIGEGYTSPYGGNHAEVNAIHAVTDKSLLKRATIYVTLEPCAHFGKTPPCADLIVSSKIPKVVIGCIDSNAQVAGKGVERLLQAGCQVVVGVLEKECLEQHKRFFTVQNKKRPYLILKWAETRDGFIAPLKKEENRPVWISNGASQQLVHKWRSEEHAILVGTETAIADNPKLDVRKWGGNNPIRVVLDKSLRIPSGYSLFDQSVKTIVLTSKKNSIEKKETENLIYKGIDFSENMAAQICEVLMEENIQSLLVEGGRQTLQSFIEAGLWDEARVFVGPVSFKEGILAPKLEAGMFEEKDIKGTKLSLYKNSKQA